MKAVNLTIAVYVVGAFWLIPTLLALLALLKG